MKSKKIDLATSPVVKTFISYAIPSVLGMLMISVAGIVDGLFIGRYVGADALAAVSIVYPVTSLAIGFAIMIGTGGTTTASAEIGAGNILGARNTFTITALLVTFTALLFMFLGIFFADSLALFFGKKGGLEDEVKTYMVPLLFFFIPFMHSWILDVFIRNDGIPVFPSVILVISALINIFLDYLFVARFSWGLRGAALATGGSQLVPALIFWVYILKGKTSYKLVKPVFHLNRIKKMLYNGASEFINEFSVGFSAILFNMALLYKIGSLGVASYGVIQYVTMISVMIFFGIAQASQAGISYNLGVGNRQRILAFRRVALTGNILVSCVSVIILLFFNRAITSVFTKGNIEVINLVSEIAVYYSWAYIPMAINISFSMYFTSIHYARESALTAVLRSLILFLICLYLLPGFLGIKGLWLTVLFAESLTLLVVLGLLIKKPLNQEYLDSTRERLR